MCQVMLFFPLCRKIWNKCDNCSISVQYSILLILKVQFLSLFLHVLFSGAVFYQAGGVNKLLAMFVKARLKQKETFILYCNQTRLYSVIMMRRLQGVQLFVLLHCFLMDKNLRQIHLNHCFLTIMCVLPCFSLNSPEVRSIHLLFSLQHFCSNKVLGIYHL